MITRLEEIINGGGAEAEFIQYIIARWGKCVIADNITGWSSMAYWMKGESIINQVDGDDDLAAELDTLASVAYKHSLIDMSRYEADELSRP